MTRTHIHKHFWHYLLLGCILVGGMMSYFMVNTRGTRMGIIGMTAVAYFLWGMLHHFHHKDLHWKIVLEYGGFALLGICLLLTLLY